MIKEVLMYLLEITKVVEIIRKWGLGSKTKIEKMLNMVWINDIGVDVVNNIPNRKYGRKKTDQKSKYTILDNGAYYVHHDWKNNQKVREKVGVYFPWYGH